MIVVSDTTPLISLLKINRINLFIRETIWRGYDSPSSIQ